MRERNYQMCLHLLLTDVFHYLVTFVAYRRTHLLSRHCNSGQLSLSSLRGRWIEYQPARLGWRRGGHLCRMAGNTVWSHWQVTSRSSEVNFTKNYTLLSLLVFNFHGIFISWASNVTKHISNVRHRVHHQYITISSVTLFLCFTRGLKLISFINSILDLLYVRYGGLPSISNASLFRFFKYIFC